MSQRNNNQPQEKTYGMLFGIVIGAVFSLGFAKTGNPGLIGVGAVLGMSIGNSIGKSLNCRNNVE